MALFDNMKNKLSAAGQNTVQKAKDLTEISRLNSAITAAEDQVRELYTTMGYEVYRAYYEKPLPEVEGLIQQITDLHQKIEEYKNQIDIINEVKTCPQCGGKVNKDMAFCGNCGYKMPVVEPPVVEETKPAFCGTCGAPISPDAAFCTNCGNKLG